MGVWNIIVTAEYEKEKAEKSEEDEDEGSTEEEEEVESEDTSSSEQGQNRPTHMGKGVGQGGDRFFCDLMIPAINLWKSPNFYLFVEKKIGCLQPDQGIYPKLNQPVEKPQILIFSLPD